MHTFITRVAVVVSVLALVLTACGNGATGPAATAATVDGVDIPRSVLDDAVRDIVEATHGDVDDLDADQRAAAVEPVQNQVLSLLIQAQIISGLAASYGYEEDPDEVEELLEAEVAQAGGEEVFEGMVLQSGLTMALVRDVFLPTQLEVAAIREQLLEDVEPLEERTVRHILVDTEAEAEDIIDELDAGADFGELAAARSSDPGSAVDGGSLGSAGPGAYVDEFDDAVWQATLGEVVGPVESQFGFHVFEVTDETVTDPEDFAPGQAEQAIGQELQVLIEEAFASADVEVASGLGVWDPETSRVVSDERVGDGDQ